MENYTYERKTVEAMLKQRRELARSEAAAKKSAIDRKAEEDKSAIDRKAEEDKRAIDRKTDEEMVKISREEDAIVTQWMRIADQRRKERLADMERIAALQAQIKEGGEQ